MSLFLLFRVVFDGEYDGSELSDKSELLGTCVAYAAVIGCSDAAVMAVVCF